MSDAFDALDDDVAEGPRHPMISGAAPELATPNVPEPRTPAEMRRAGWEFPAYLVVQVSWFAGFGLQMVLFSYLATQILHVSPELFGVAQISLTAPSIFLILFGGVLAERAEGRLLLLSLHALASLPTLALAFAVQGPGFAFWMILVYGIVMGSIGAFMMPARDAILNAVIARRQALGSALSLQQGVAIASLAQFAAQLCGLSLGGMAGTFGVSPLLVVQSLLLGSGAVAALFLCAARVMPEDRAPATNPFRAIAESFGEVGRSPVIGPMILSTFGIGVFVIGSFLVILPIFSRDAYKGGSGFLSLIFVTFWLGAFFSALAMTRFRHLPRPGVAMLLAQGFGSLCMLVLTLPLSPNWFLGLCFVWGLAAGVSITVSRAIVQNAAPKAHLARVLAVYQLGFMGGAPIGAGIAGLAVHHWGLYGAPWLPATGLMAIVLILAFATPIWRVRGE